MHPIPSRFNKIKNAIGLLPTFRHVFRKKSFDVRTSRDAKLFDKFINFACRFIPYGKGQYCRNALCHRASFCYGPLYRHENINECIHSNQHLFFGSVNIKSLAQGSLMFKKKKLVKADGEDIYVNEKNIKEKLNFPIAFISGEKNSV
jgi:cholesterol oxidase